MRLGVGELRVVVDDRVGELVANALAFLPPERERSAVTACPGR
ncbi:MAG TPA: hypothetical protein VE780_10385 [Thermoleophilaceae bacterium]|nr:hypothetical protein [Thermoleophilaceae bacterium]